ncbi:DUF885 domain-containing protein [Thalassotalea agarivorans]|uniref:Uncharacterized conserved protein, DUF885 familyt n=1 Tax=Thalassotalea agarivorans TaxID=349064 RepID=A0A1I0ELG5_THASX|nr:DUF885 domain-containing protein [Thalassotalea agarivorans]SET46221.1 Uncharacterized conserved protein, DUF885 familyt [Thalassotalea agarivorans]
MFKKSLVAIAMSSMALVGCSEPQVNNTPQAPAQAEVAQVSVEEASKQANAVFDKIFMDAVKRNPVSQTYLGIKDDYDKWNDLSEENAVKEIEYAKQSLATIKAIDPSNLDAQTKLSRTLFIQQIEQQIADFKWRYHSYPVNQMFGTHSQIPAFLINQHLITNVQEAKDYISRVINAKPLIEQLIEQLKIREEKGIVAPKFVYEHVIRDSKNIITGAPFSEGEDSTILADFKKKLAKIDATEAEQKALMQQLTAALTSQLKPAYDGLVTYLEGLEQRADNRDGAWKFPEGEAFYNNALNRTTTTDLTAEQIHEIGLSEVDRIHQEMREIMVKVNFDGDLAAFFEFMRHDPQFYYPDTQEGRDRYIAEAVALIDDMKGRLDTLFLTKPKAELKVKAVEAFREKSAGKAFYQAPAPDGSRPGVYYANLYKMEAMPTYQMAALAYHEGIPGHHMQLAINQELEGIPMFRKFGRYTAHTEGWGLYSEFIPKEIGLYQDPYSDFGRLAMELWRACRLVVDTGIHAKKWTREQGIAYYVENTPNAESDAVKMVERHVVMPSQATAYKIGMIKILELRENARQQMGDKFDIREYHDIILQNGPLPLNVLADRVDEYIASK